jgi:acetylornithine deacetylase/succinyl-diaminopimelate desuccinylase-like protein
MNLAEIQSFVSQRWDDDIVDRLVEYVKVPAKSPAFDASWAAHGHLEQVVRSAQAWCQAQGIAGMTLEIVTIDGMTPCLVFDVPATQGLGNDRTVMFYGHLDKQPEMTGWRDGFGPWTPVIESGRLYGRGAADDGYAVYSALTVIAALDRQGIPRPRCVGLIETCEESGLDSGCGNYDQLWVTTSLRGLVGGKLSVEILDEGVHSGMASGIVPSSFRIARHLLSRIEDSKTGRVLLSGLHADIPAERLEQARAAGDILGDAVWQHFPWVGCSHGPEPHAHAMPTTTDPVEAILNRTWRPALSVTGAAGLPAPEAAGNVLRPRTVLKLSMRIPPTVDAQAATAAMRAALEDDPPYQARVRFEADWGATGWNAPSTASWLDRALREASLGAFGRDPAWFGEGGTIPFMNMLGEHFPQAQFLITGVLGPRSNAHGPNEFLDIGYAKKLTTAVASVVAAVR